MPVTDSDDVRDSFVHDFEIAGQLEDKPIECIDCSQEFVWTAGEQHFFYDKNLLNPPKRCKECKTAKNRRIEAIELSKATGKRHHIEMQAKCASCFTLTTVPFYPSQGRPVYCRECYASLRAKAANGKENGL